MFATYSDASATWTSSPTLHDPIRNLPRHHRARGPACPGQAWSSPRANGGSAKDHRLGSTGCSAAIVVSWPTARRWGRLRQGAAVAKLKACRLSQDWTQLSIPAALSFLPRWLRSDRQVPKASLLPLLYTPVGRRVSSTDMRSSALPSVASCARAV